MSSLPSSPLADEPLRNALTYCDMTTTPDGEPVAIASRLSEIRERYGPGHLVTRLSGSQNRTSSMPCRVCRTGRYIATCKKAAKWRLVDLNWLLS
jgi:hypothetical protein